MALDSKNRGGAGSDLTPEELASATAMGFDARMLETIKSPRQGASSSGHPDRENLRNALYAPGLAAPPAAPPQPPAPPPAAQPQAPASPPPPSTPEPPPSAMASLGGGATPPITAPTAMASLMAPPEPPPDAGMDVAMSGPSGLRPNLGQRHPPQYNYALASLGRGVY